MRVIAVDPGYDRLGIAVMEVADGAEKIIHSECVETDKNNPLTKRMQTAGDSFLKMLKTYQPDALAIETLFFNQNQKTAIAVAQMRGIIIYLAQNNNCQVFEFGPQEIKIAVTGYGKSDKGAVIDMVKRLIKNAPENALDDEYDAIAVGITCLAQHGRNQ